MHRVSTLAGGAGVLTDADVASLYRCLLDRAPERADTIAAFREYYGCFGRGRAAILQSAEFAAMFDDLVGAAPARLAQAFLRRAGGAIAADQQPPNSAMAGAMRLILRAHARVHLAVVIGDAGIALSDLLPLETARAAVLHVAPEFPAFLPQIGALEGGAALFRIGLDAAALGALLRQAALPIDVLIVPHDAAHWIAALEPVLAERAIVIGGAGTAAATGHLAHAERPLALAGMQLCMRGGWFLPVAYAPLPHAPARPPDHAPALWLAAIVRDEAASVVNMLQSVAAIASGFVVLDTGGTDATLARAEDFLRSLGKPYVLHTHVTDRFDDMRNAALDLVPPHAAWVLMLDADEELCAEDHAPLLELLRTADRDAYALPRYNYVGADKAGEVAPYPDRQVRLLRHGCTPRLRYRGAVHEKVLDAHVGLLPLDAAALGLDRGGPHIHHLVRRYRTAAAEAAKQARYRDIQLRYEGK